MQFPAIEFENESELKRQFAELWLALPDDPFKAACNLFGSDYGKASFVAQKWVIDPEVTAYTKTILKERGAKSFLPTKEDLAHKVFKSAENAFEYKDKCSLFKLYAEIMGFIEKPVVVTGKNGGPIEVATTLALLDYDPDDPESIARAHEAFFGTPEAVRNIKGGKRTGNC